MVPLAITGTALPGRPSPIAAASSRPSVCVRCPRHENLPTQGTKGAFPIFVKSTRCARAKRREGEVSREAEPAWAFSCAALGGFRVTGLAENRRLEWRATFDEGRRKTECQMRATKYSIRPSSQYGDATFQRRNAARQAAVVRGSRR